MIKQKRYSLVNVLMASVFFCGVGFIAGRLSFPQASEAQLTRFSDDSGISTKAKPRQQGSESHVLDSAQEELHLDKNQDTADDSPGLPTAQDFMSAWQLANSLEREGDKNARRIRLLTNWLNSDPSQVLALVQAEGAVTFRQEELLSIGLTAVEQSLPEIDDFLFSIGPGELRQVLVSHMAHQKANQDYLGALAWSLAQADPAEEALALSQVLSFWSSADPGDFLEHIQLGDIPASASNEMTQHAAYLSALDQGAEVYLNNLNIFPGDAQPAVFSGLISALSEQSPERAYDWLKEQSNEVLKTRGLQQFAAATGHQRPDLVFSLAQTLPSSPQRDKLLQSSLFGWTRTDPLSARKAIAQSALLDEEEKARLNRVFEAR